MFGDIVRLPVADDYMSLGFKVIAALRWALEHVASRFILKVDEDTWVHAEALTHFLNVQFELPMTVDWYGGWVTQSRVIRSGSWGVPFDIYPEDEYPTYVSGGGYVLSRRAAFRILQVRTHSQHE